MKRKHKNNSLSVKTARSTIQSCILFGLVVQLVALPFYAVTLTSQYIKNTGTTVKQVRMSVKHGTDSSSYARQVMEVYRGLTEEERQKVGTAEYRELFSQVDTTTKWGAYDVLVNMLEGTLSFHVQNDVSDIYVAMYDEETSAMVYIVDPAELPDRLMPGDWKPVNKVGMMKFLSAKDDDEVLYDIGWTKNYGLLCTVGVPIRDNGEIVSFMLADISLDNILAGMGAFSLGLTVVLIVVTAFIAWMQTRHIKETLVKPINMIAQASSEFAENKTGEIKVFANLDVHTGDEIERLAKTMNDMENSLYEYEQNLLKVTKEKERVSAELNMAAQIQEGMLPNIYPAFPDRPEFDIYATMTPAREVGGDFYDFFLVDDDHLCIVIADVSGKGVPAALFMMASKIILANNAMMGKSPAEILTDTNAAICSNNKMQMFVTVWLGILEISTGKLTAANAGHEYPALKHADGRFELFKDKHGFVIGMMNGLQYKEYELVLEPGAKLFVYTDGVPEATDADEEMFRTERMLAALNKNPDDTLVQLLENVHKSVDEFVKDAEQFDDLTMLAITLL